MAVTKIGYEEFPIDFYANPLTSLIKPKPDTRTPYEQYEAGEKWIYVDLSDFFPNQEPYWITRDSYFDKFMHRRHLEYMRSISKHSKLNLRMD